MTTRSIPWPRIFAEGVAIVVSILLAFGIQAWWEGRQESQRETAYLLALRQEAQENRSVFEERLSLAEGRLEDIDRLFGSVISAPGTVPRDSLMARIRLAPGTTGQPQTAALTDLLSSGGLGLVEAPEVRRQIALYEGLLQSAIQRQEQHAQVYRDDLSRYLRAHMSVVEAIQPELLRGPFELDSEAFVRNREFGNIVFTYRSSAARLRFAVQQLLDGIDELDALLAR
jgi:hypothetical protein